MTSAPDVDAFDQAVVHETAHAAEDAAGLLESNGNLRVVARAMSQGVALERPHHHRRKLRPNLPQR